MTTSSKRTLHDPNDPRDVRGAIRRVEAELTAESPPALRKAIQALVDALALGPAPELRECPKCGNIGMRDATRCGHCWVHLSPIAAAD